VQWCIAKTGGGYTQRGVAKGLKVPCLFMIAEVSIRCQKNPGGWYTAYTRVYPQYTTANVLFAPLGMLLGRCRSDVFSPFSRLLSELVGHLVNATGVTAGPAESNGRLLPGLWRDLLHVTCGLTACTPGSALGPTLGNVIAP